MGEFLRSVDRVLALMRGISAEIKDSERKSTAKQLSKLKKQLGDLAVEIDLVHLAAEDDGLSEAETARRNEVIVDIENKYAELEKRLKHTEPELSTPLSTYSSQAQQFETRFVQRSQENSMIELESSVSSLKYLGHDINTELKTHNQILTRVEEDIDRNVGLLEKVQTKLMSYVSGSSNCSLYCLILVLIVIFFLVLVYL